MVEEKNYKVLDVEPHPSGGFLITWKPNYNPKNYTKKTHVPIDDVDKALKTIEDLAKTCKAPEQKTNDKVKQLKEKFKQKGVLK